MSIEHQKIIPIRNNSEKMPSGLCIKYIATAFGGSEEITEEILMQLVNQIRASQNVGVYLSQDPDLEGDYMIIESDNGWISYSYVENMGTLNECFYSSYNPAYLESEEESPIRCSDGQSIILKRYTMHDSELAAKCIEYFVRSGKLYPGMTWLKS